MTEVPKWEQRVRSPQLLSVSLLAPAISWADAADRGVLLANSTGRTEVFAFDSSTIPATLTQISDRPQGTMAGAISPDGSIAFWFDDEAGDEVGRWQQVALSDGVELTLLPDLDRAYPGGLVPLADGTVVVGRLLDAPTETADGFELAVAANDGKGDVVYACADPAELVDVSHDGALALLAFAPAGDWLHLGVRVVRLADGLVTAQLVDQGRNLTPIGFHPADPDEVLLTHERGDFAEPCVWRLGSGQQDDVTTGLVGDVAAGWYPDGEALLLSVLQDARHTLFRYERSSGDLSRIPTPRGTVARASARRDGSVHVLMSAFDLPVSLLRSHEDRSTTLVRLPGEPPPATTSATDVHVEGVAGTIHALVCAPPGPPPHPTVFVPHGGPTMQDFDAWNDRQAAFVDAGYAVVRVNYRGSTGYGAAWRDALHGRLGFIELEDICAVRDHLEAKGFVDPERVSMVGASWGGFLTLMAAGTQPDRWRSGVALVPLADQFTSAEDSPSFMRAYDAVMMGGSIEEIPDVYRASSPITYVDSVTAPLYITAGENDPRCPVRQVDTYVERLRARGHDVRYDRTATGHALADVDMKVHELRQILDFLERTLPPEPLL